MGSLMGPKAYRFQDRARYDMYQLSGHFMPAAIQKQPDKNDV